MKNLKLKVKKIVDVPDSMEDIQYKIEQLRYHWIAFKQSYKEKLFHFIPDMFYSNEN